MTIQEAIKALAEIRDTWEDGEHIEVVINPLASARRGVSSYALLDIWYVDDTRSRNSGKVVLG